jgi:hypothetical protein
VESFYYRPSSQCIFGEGEAELFPLSENTFMPGKSSVEVEPEIFDVVCLGELHIVDMERLLKLQNRKSCRSPIKIK